MRRALCIAAIAGVLPSSGAGALRPVAASTSGARDLTALVNPLSGTLGSGFPMVAAVRPFGMMEIGPDTGLVGGADPVNYDGYSYQDPAIRGFALTHFDGAGIHIAGDLPFLPTTGTVSSVNPDRIASLYDHATEIAQPGYYGVTLDSYRTRVELTSTERAAVVRLTYPATTRANILFDSSRSITGLHPSAISVLDSHTIAGWSRSESAPNGYLVYFTATLDHAITATGTWNGSTLSPGSRSTAGSANGAWVTVDTSAGAVVTMRIAMSYVDAAGAAANMAAELPPSATFDSVRRDAHNAWDARLHDIVVSGGEVGQQATFYTNLYRALLMPSLFDDADGRYAGFDGAVHSVAPGAHHYTSLSLWDTYRTENPLLELIEPTVEHDVMISLLDDYDQNHSAIPRWVQANHDDTIMGGDSGSAFLADGVMRGLLTGAEATRAYAALEHQAMTLPPASAREHLDAYLAQGYIGHDISGIGAALTQEYAIDDNAVSGVAGLLGDSATAAALAQRAGSWRRLLDPGSHFIRPRNSDGTWANPTSAGPLTLPWSPDFQDGYQEGTGWQYLWLEPQDVAGLTAAIGGTATTVSRLDSFFSQALTGVPYVVPVAQQYASVFGIYYVGNQFTPANEPDLQSGFYYDWLGQPWKTQEVVRAAMQTYSARPDGLPGNDDTGTMSAWYVLAALGIYGTTPGVPVYVLTTPAFAQADIHVGGSRVFTIVAPGASTLMRYAQSAALDGGALDRTFLTQCDLRGGGALTWALGSTASGWGSGPGDAPPSLSDAQPNAAVTACEAAIAGGSG